MQALESVATEPGTPAERAWRGIELCRRGDWQEGFYHLSLAADATVETSAVPSLFFAYLGYGLARFQDEVEQGLRLCRRGVELDVYQSESYYCLARTFHLAGDRRSAVDAVERGLRIDATSEVLQKLRAELGERRRPLLPFLARRNLLNRTFGRLRHSLLGARGSEKS